MEYPDENSKNSRPAPSATTPDPLVPDRVRVRCVFHGEVQGVGFRFTALHLSRRFSVSGFVRNLPDGTVELLCEAAPKETRNFIAEIRRTMFDHIDETEMAESPASGEFTGFEIR